MTTLAAFASSALTETHHSTLKCSSPVCIATTSTRTVSTPCGHVFHHGCLARQLERSDRCAHCQTRLYIVPKSISTLLPTPTPTRRNRRSEMNKESQQQKATKAANDVARCAENLNNVSKGLHLVAETMQRAARDMDALTREANVEKIRRVERERRMW